ncbi:MAG: tRNA lysidine(34) synthetase TilS [Elusimicrobiota bacterium]
MSNIVWEKFKKTVLGDRMIQPHDRVLIAVSGGPDSVCLLHLFCRLKKIMDIDISAAYINHKLRPEDEIKKEIGKIKSTTSLHGVPLYVKNLKPPAKKSNLEKWARDARYKALLSIALSGGYEKIAMGHNQNDQAETVLLSIIRSTGEDGIPGIPASRVLTAPRTAHAPRTPHSRKKITLVRPLINITRKEITGYLREKDLPYSSDSTNLDTAITRNFLRLKVMPLLESRNPSITQHLSNLAVWSESINGYFENLTRRALSSILISSGKQAGKNYVALDLLKFLRYNKCLRYRLMKSILMMTPAITNYSKAAGVLLGKIEKASGGRIPRRLFVRTGNVSATIRGGKLYLKL